MIYLIFSQNKVMSYFWNVFEEVVFSVSDEFIMK